MTKRASRAAEQSDPRAAERLRALVDFANGTRPASPYLKQCRHELRAWLRALADGRPLLLRTDWQTFVGGEICTHAGGAR